jgi:hypothetical protein
MHNPSTGFSLSYLCFMFMIVHLHVGLVCFHIRSSEGDRLASMSKFDYVLMHTGFMRSRKLSSFDSR